MTWLSDRDAAYALMCEYTQQEGLRRHMLSVEIAMRAYAVKLGLGRDVEKWGIVGLLHDFDYERWPEEPEHTREGANILRARGVDEEVVGAILSHAKWNQTEYPLDRPIRKALFAVDELCGFITAVAYVRPNGLDGMKAKSVRKKLKAKNFAAAVSREDIDQGAALLGMDLNEHITEVIIALQKATK